MADHVEEHYSHQAGISQGTSLTWKCYERAKVIDIVKMKVCLPGDVDAPA